MIKEYLNKIIDSNHDRLEAQVKVDGEGDQVIYIYSSFCKGVVVNVPEDRKKVFQGISKGLLGIYFLLPAMIAYWLFRITHNHVYKDFFMSVTIIFLGISFVWYFYNTWVVTKNMKWTKFSYSVTKSHK